MKQGKICKELHSGGVTPQELEAVNRYTRRPLEAGEIYVFPMILCDNQVDRDWERFSTEALEKLAGLFLGKTGIFDHMARGENQVARIFETQVRELPEQSAADGEPYRCLAAKAYMVRSEKNRDLILEIDGGIKKEVSVGCAVDRVLCSVCGRDVRREPCGHVKGEAYGGAVCHHVLEHPTDAYEWSFVAVPAQPAAGVTKAAGGGPEELDLLLQKQGKLTLTPGQAQALRERLEQLNRLAAAGEEHRQGLIKALLGRAALSGCGVDGQVLLSIAERLDARQLGELCKAFPQSGGTGLPQTAPAQGEGGGAGGQGNQPFLI